MNFYLKVRLVPGTLRATNLLLAKPGKKALIGNHRHDGEHTFRRGGDYDMLVG